MQACSQLVLSTLTKVQGLLLREWCYPQVLKMVAHRHTHRQPNLEDSSTRLSSHVTLDNVDNDYCQSTLGIVLCYADVRKIDTIGHDYFLCLCRKLYHHNNAQLGMAVMRAGLTNWHAGNIEVGHGMICKAYAILLVTHGPSHPITKDLEVNSILVDSHCLVGRSLEMGVLMHLDFALWKSVGCQLDQKGP